MFLTISIFLIQNISKKNKVNYKLKRNEEFLEPKSNNFIKNTSLENNMFWKRK